MTDHDALRRQLTKIRDRTAGAEMLDPAYLWLGGDDWAGKRRFLDDEASGRLAWRQAHNSAEAGLRALDAGDVEMAEVCLTNALWLYVGVLERWADTKRLSRPARRRGRPRKVE